MYLKRLWLILPLFESVQDDDEGNKCSWMGCGFAQIHCLLCFENISVRLTIERKPRLEKTLNVRYGQEGKEAWKEPKPYYLNWGSQHRNVIKFRPEVKDEFRIKFWASAASKVSVEPVVEVKRKVRDFYMNAE